MRIADSCAHPGGDVVWPGLGWQGSTPVAAISAPPPHINPLQDGGSCQLSFWPIMVCPENSCSSGFAKAPGTKNGAPFIEGPRALTRTVAGELPSMINPPIITLSPLWTKLRVEMLLNSAWMPSSTSKTRSEEHTS